MEKFLPLIVTLRLDDQAQSLFNALRKRHFPPALNVLDAHLTLFHHLPSHLPSITHTLQQGCNRPTFQLSATAPYHTGNGVAIRIESTPLKQLHGHLQHAFEEWLIPQDRQSIRPHVTIQNKAGATASKTLYQQLQQEFVAFTAVAMGLDTWLYHNGPWTHRDFFPFTLGAAGSS